MLIRVAFLMIIVYMILGFIDGVWAFIGIWRQKGFIQFEIIINVLVIFYGSTSIINILILSVWGSSS